MSDDWDDTYGENEYSDGPKGLREAYENLKNKVKQVEAERDDYKGKWQTRVVGDVLTGQGFKNPDRVKRGLLADKIDLADKAAVDSWLAENGDDYARVQGSETQTSTDGGGSVTEQTVSPEEMAARQQLQQAQNYQQPAYMEKLAAAMAEITPDMDGAQVVEVYKKHGV